MSINKIFASCIAALFFSILCTSCTKSGSNNSAYLKEPKIAVTPVVEEYARSVIRPMIASIPKEDKLSILLKISEILGSNEHGINAYAINPSKYIMYDIFDNFKLGFLVTLDLTQQQQQNIKSWHAKYMTNNAADVFFAPSASEIIKDKAAFGCTHYARAFVAVVTSLELIDDPKNLRYVISCVAKDYNLAYKKQDLEMTINGHQFIMVSINSNWYAINTSKSEWVKMPIGFSPDNLMPPHNLSIRFPSYPEVTFLIRKIGKNYSDEIKDNSLEKLMNIYRSGKYDHNNFLWHIYKKI